MEVKVDDTPGEDSLEKAMVGESILLDFKDDDTGSMAVVRERALDTAKAFSEQIATVRTGAFVAVHIGLDEKTGNMKGMFGSGGSTRSMMFLARYVLTELRSTLKKQGFCDCPACMTRHTLEIMKGIQEESQETPH